MALPDPLRDPIELTNEERDQLFHDHKLLSKWCASKYGKLPGFNFDEIAQASLIGLHHASRNFDPTRGVKFSTYAVRSMRRTIARVVRQERLGLRVPCYMHDRLGKLTVASAAETDGLDLSEREHKALRAMRTQSIEGQWCDAEQRPRELVDESSNPADAAARNDLAEVLADHIDELPDRLAFVVRQHGGIGCPPRTLAQIGVELGVSREMVRLLKVKALRTLRERLDGHTLNARN